MIEQKETTIGGVKYTVQEFNTLDGLFWTSTLAQLGSGLLLGVDIRDGEGIDSLDIHIGRAMRGLANHLPAKEFVHLCTKLYQDSVVVPVYDPKEFDEMFAGGKGLDNLFHLLAFVIEFNFDALAPTLKKTLADLTGLKFLDRRAPADDQEQPASPSES